MSGAQQPLTQINCARSAAQEDAQEDEMYQAMCETCLPEWPHNGARK
ncbi:hypothetical protein RR42_m2352 [Cupriavidus basilensis]|uniref:Uncharacterized protein n=1 Tax=Cupriavidus basilensis TaxID=68895 RepID=A0A0C4YC53_9BURK|nr:hypothetical protein RR42_m2352 [Cupriavidus basilensis]